MFSYNCVSPSASRKRGTPIPPSNAMLLNLVGCLPSLTPPSYARLHACLSSCIASAGTYAEISLPSLNRR